MRSAGQLIRILGLAAALAVPVAPAVALELTLTAGATRFGEARVDALAIELADGATSGTKAEVRGIRHPAVGIFGSLVLRCEHSVPRCTAGKLGWQRPDGQALEFGWRRDSSMLTVQRQSFRLRADWSEGWRIALDALELGWLPLPESAGLSALNGRLSGSARIDGEVLALDTELNSAGFDTVDGQYAAAGVAAAVRLERAADGGFTVDARWSDGEWLLGPAYLGAPVAPLRFDARGRLQDTSLRIDRFSLRQTGIVELEGQHLAAALQPLALEAAEIDLVGLDLAAAWVAGLDSLAGAFGAGDFEPAGTLSGRVAVLAGELSEAALALDDGSLADAQDRLSLEGLQARLHWRGVRDARLALSWRSGRLYRLPLGESALELVGDDEHILMLARPWRLPVLDGALVLERLRWGEADNESPRVEVDARLEPIALDELTRTLGWTEFGGRLSGQFPGIRLAGQTLEFSGGIDVELFGGRARIAGLAVERPFGSLPALSADIEFERLDLDLVTGAFEFGSMSGLLSGHMRGLRLLDWQPVAFDAWFQTLRDSPERVISQRAVESLSTLSGGAGAAASGALLGIFDRFPYRQAALGCRLAANVCTMRGLREVEGGGYMILEGRALPRLDIVAHRRRVDWPQLVAQLQAAVASP